MKVGTIVYESMDKFQGDDVDKVRIYYLRVNGIKNIRKENLKSIRENDSNIFVKLVERDAISPIPENFDPNAFQWFSCINYAPSGAVIGYIPAQDRILGSTGLLGVGFFLDRESTTTNEADLKKIEEEIDNFDFYTAITDTKVREKGIC